VAKLRINDIPASAGQGRRVEVTWEDGRAAPRVAVAELGDAPGEGDGERIRWYLEDYAEFPADPAPALAAAAEDRLAQAGTDMFRQVFSSDDAAGIWERARDKLSEVRVEVDTDPGPGPGLAWELLRDPGRDAAVALGAGAFVRTHRQAAGHPDLPEPSGDRLRVLLVICRPGGREDVPFRSVASRLVRGGADQMEGLDLDVLRPATFARLSEVLRAAHAAKRPYHVVHFDGHGTYLDLAGLGSKPDGGGGGGALLLTPLMYGISVAGPVRRGQHGYLLFEDPDTEENQLLVDGPALGRLLTATGVPVLVLNACRSAYTEARDQPGDGATPVPGETGTGQAPSGAEASLTGDVHARIRAYGSLAAEVADIGVPGVVAMRYNVYVVTAAQYMADLYAHLLTGCSLGQAATAARQALAADPVRQIGAKPVSLQDWAVPVVYEAAPLELLRPPERTAPLIKIDPTDTGTEAGAARPGELPRPPDAGFFGRDETLLALDRAFDSRQTVLLHAFAGAGKSATAAEFARWYQATGGLDLPDSPDWPGAVLWSSFEHHLTADRVIGTAGDFFAALLEANGIQWQAVTDPGQRRNYVMQVLAQLPVLWIWDNIEPVTGFPAGSRSDWAQAEQDDLLDLLRDLAERTRCKVLLTSRRDERDWLGNVPARVRLPSMPMRESLQLAAALAKGHDHSIAGADWRPLLRYAAGNPLTITVLVGQALRENLTATEDIENLVTRLRAGEAELEEGEDAALGRTRSLAASLSYGFRRHRRIAAGAGPDPGSRRFSRIPTSSSRSAARPAARRNDCRPRPPTCTATIAGHWSTMTSGWPTPAPAPGSPTPCSRGERRDLRVVRDETGRRGWRGPVPDLRRPTVVPRGQQRHRMPLLSQRDTPALDRHVTSPAGKQGRPGRRNSAKALTNTASWRRSCGAPNPSPRAARTRTGRLSGPGPAASARSTWPDSGPS